MDYNNYLMSLIDAYLNQARQENISNDDRNKALKSATELIYEYIEENSSLIKNDKKKYMFLEMTNLLLASLNIGIAINNKNNIYFVVAYCWLINCILSSIKLSSTNELAKKIKKYKYFLENQDTINQEIIERYKKEHKNSNNYSLGDAPVITVADIDDMDVKELQETVELIKKSN